MNDLKKRILKLEELTGGQNFSERMERIFQSESFDELSSNDVEALKELMPDKFEILTKKITEEMEKNL